MRKYPYYFEIESQIVDKLNTMVKDHFLMEMREVSKKLLEQCSEEVTEFIESVNKDVDYIPDVAEGIRDCLREKEREFYSGVEHAVKTDAAKLDGLLVYKMQKGFFYNKQGEIFEGLEKAARLGYESIGDLSKDLSKDDFTQKTTIIREVLKKHYIESVQKSHKSIGENIAPPFINILQEIQKEIVAKIDSLYRTNREKVLRLKTSDKYDSKRKENEVRVKRYRTLTEQIEKIQKDLDFSSPQES